MKTINTTLISLLGLTLAGVSIVCEVLFFMSFAETLTDKSIAAITAVALVGCQFVFLGVAIHSYKFKMRFLSVCFLLVLVFLLFISVSGTASFFESRFLQQQQKTLKNSDVYLLEKQIIDDLALESQAFKAAALTANKKGNSWYAGSLLKKAQKSTADRLHVVEKIKTMQPIANKSGASLAEFSGGFRWVIWVIMAALVDVCALLCFAFLNTFNGPVVDHEKISAMQKQPTENKKQTEQKQDLETLIKHEITTGQFGPVPGMRAVMAEHNKSHGYIKNIFEDLIRAGILKRADNLRTFELVAQA